MITIDDTNKATNFSLSPLANQHVVDIIVPVFNGYNFLRPLLESIGKTMMNYQLILVDDHSTDNRVESMLIAYRDSHPGVLLIKNEENLGFVKSVNKALAQSKHHVAIVNTDVEVPNNWLERLMAPILNDDLVASSTPFTNSGTICSFPDFCKDNPYLLDNFTLEQIDDVFKSVRPNYVHIPTGVGFCMGMNRNAIDEIGVFDDMTFGRGYSEENDWCQRAISAGYYNVVVENLFVYHKHGGSFTANEKQTLLDNHLPLLAKKYPNYNRDVTYFQTLDPEKNIRQYVMLTLLNNLHDIKSVLAFDHAWGGGATQYLDNKKSELLEANGYIIIIRYHADNNNFSLEYSYHTLTYTIFVHSIEQIFLLLPTSICEIWINELVSYPNLFTFLKRIVNLAMIKSSKLIMLLHDFYCVCPYFVLLDDNNEYCGIPEVSRCDECVAHKGSCGLKIQSMDLWRAEWDNFLNKCDAIIAFSNDSLNHLKRAYPGLTFPLIKVIPHTIRSLPKIQNRPTKNIMSRIIIGILGGISVHKGAKIIEKMLEIIDDQDLNIYIVLIGYWNLPAPKSSKIKATGHYEREDLINLTVNNDIDIFLMPSICPETFSYTTAEIMEMGMPIAVFNLGAPAERVVDYPLGHIISKIDAECALNEIVDFVHRLRKE